MKKVLFIVCVLALVSVTMAAYATPTNWLISIKAVNPTTFGGGAGVAVGVGTAANQVASWPTSAGSTANAESTNEAAFHSRDMDAAGLGSYSWDLKLGARTDYVPQQIAICIWNNRTASLGVGGELDHSLIYRLEKKVGESYVLLAWFSDVMGGPDNPALWRSTADIMKASASWSPSATNQGFYVLDTVTTAGGFAGLGDYRLTAAPIPEPGSLMALGSGLIGLAGFAIRRRRA